MKKVTRELLSTAARICYFRTNETACNMIENEWMQIEKMVLSLSSSVEEYDLKFEIISPEITLSNLRQDNIDRSELLTPEQIFANAYDSIDGFIAIPNSEVVEHEE